MASGFDDIKNGLAFGALAGAFVEYASLNITGIKFWSDWMASAAHWFTTQTWWPAGITAVVASYALSVIIFAAIGGWIDKK
jgi:hypothetical protein